MTHDEITAGTAQHVTARVLTQAIREGIGECAEVGHPLNELQQDALWRMALVAIDGTREEVARLLAVDHLLRVVSKPETGEPCDSVMQGIPCVLNDGHAGDHCGGALDSALGFRRWPQTPPPVQASTDGQVERPVGLYSVTTPQRGVDEVGE